MPERQIKVAAVRVGPRKRQFCNASTLARNFEVLGPICGVGLLHPIVVVRAGRGYDLVAGRRRLEAYRLLGKETIPARVFASLTAEQRLLIELSENLEREELTHLERADHLKAQKDLYEQVHPEARHGGRRNRGGSKKKQDAKTAPFAEAAGTATGRSARSIQEDVQIAEGLSEDVKERIRGTPLEDEKMALLEIARLPEEQQAAAVEERLRLTSTEDRQVGPEEAAPAPQPEKPFDLREWCRGVVVGVTEPVAAALRICRCLADPHCEGSAAALEEITRRRWE